MKISLAQTQPVAGNLEANIEIHLDFVRQAIEQDADLVIFSELSLTGYEPELANDLAINLNDSRLDPFQDLCDSHNTIICVGAPTKADNGICISLIIFQPNKERSHYAKQHLHEDEDPYFVPGPPTDGIIHAEKRIALAICYELTIPEHSQTANDNGAEVYIASVAKTVNGVARNNPRLSEIAMRFSIPVLMCNCVGEFDGNIGGGQSGSWDVTGNAREALDADSPGILTLEI